jgi:malonyl CoA-acyl carrier protein transacylase
MATPPAAATTDAPTSATDNDFATYTPKIAFLFPGQGAQTVGMAKARPHATQRRADRGTRTHNVCLRRAAQPCVHSPSPLRHTGIHAHFWGCRASRLCAALSQSLVEEVPAAAAMFKRASEILGYDLLKVCVEGPKEKLDMTAVRFACCVDSHAGAAARNAARRGGAA